MRGRSLPPADRARRLPAPDRTRSAHACSCELPTAAATCKRYAADEEPERTDDQRDDREQVRAPADRADDLDRRRGILARLRIAPVDDLAVGVGLLHLERVRPRLRGLREELEERVLFRRHMAAGPGHLRDHRTVT